MLVGPAPGRFPLVPLLSLLVGRLTPPPRALGSGAPSAKVTRRRSVLWGGGRGLPSPAGARRR